ncbi:MAG: serine/threonine-protein kinase [Planctomycetota bacterium]|jgi:serine/threonine-protein kinase
MPGSVNIAGYELLEKIGSGAAGTVYKARQISMDRLVAIKMLPGDLAKDKRFIERFQREARAVAKLNHPHVVTGIDVGESGGYWYFVMEYVDGESAASRVGRDEAIPEKEALEIARQVSLALDHAYKNGIIHRDIKPANILMTSGGLAKLADLGVAKQGEGEGGAGGRVFGTPYYMSPEQARGGGDIDIRSDIYSLGATLYHLLTGKPPFHGHPPAVVMAKQIAEEPEDPRKLNPRISRGASALVGCMMAKDRDDRPETPNDLEEEIKRVQKGRAPARAKAAAHAPAHAPGRARHHVESAPQSSSEKGGMIVAAAVGAVILLGAAAWALLGSDKKPETNPGGGSGPRVTLPGGSGRAPRTDGGGPSRPDPEKVARKAYKALRARELPPKKELAEIGKFIKAHPDTAAAGEAAGRAERLEAEIESRATAAAMAAKVAALREQARGYVERGRFDRALEVFRVEATGTLASLLAKEVASLHQAAELAILKASSSVARLCEKGEFEKARDEINAINVDGMDDLVEELKGLLARVDDIERTQADAKERKTLAEGGAVYAVLCAKVNTALAELKPDDADRLLRTARRDRRLAPLSEYLSQDQEHVGYFREVLAAAAKGVSSLKGNTRTFKMRDGSEERGRIQSADEGGVTIERRIKSVGGATVRVTLTFPNLSDEEIVSLAMSALNERASQTRLKTAVLYAVGGDIAAAKRELDSARKLGADTASVERRWVKAADEIRAGKLLVEARRLFAIHRAAQQQGDAGALDRAKAGLAKVLGELKQYSHTEIYKANFSRKPGGSP